jgi:hypothetical protein
MPLPDTPISASCKAVVNKDHNRAAFAAHTSALTATPMQVMYMVLCLPACLYFITSTYCTHPVCAYRFPPGVQLLNLEELPGAGAMGVAINGLPIFPASDNHNALFCKSGVLPVTE